MVLNVFVCDVTPTAAASKYYATSAALYTQPNFQGVPLVFRVSPGVGMCTVLPAPFSGNLSSIVIAWNVSSVDAPAPGSTPVVCSVVTFHPTTTCSGGWSGFPVGSYDVTGCSK